MRTMGEEEGVRWSYSVPFHKGEISLSPDYITLTGRLGSPLLTVSVS